jgi:class 3 adenylate cyclase
MEAPTLERKLIAILAADAVGYSRLMEKDESAALGTLTARRTIIDGLIASFRGRIAGTAGDSVLAEFASVFDAVECAVRIQAELEAADSPMPEADRMPFRIGINVGDVMVKDGDIFGDGVNIAARLQTLAIPGGICVSRGVRDHIRHKLPFGFEDLGEQSVKNIAQPIRVFRLRPEGPLPEEPEAAPATNNAPAQASGAAMPIAGSVDPQAIELSFWESIKDSDQLTDFEAYLERYPAGTFAALARSRLESNRESDASNPQQQAVELTYWESVKDSDNPEMIEAYLKKYPTGEFQDLACIRLEELRNKRRADE